MKNHLDNLIEKLPNLLHRRILDLGSGRGKFLAEVRARGGDIVGLDADYERAKATGAIWSNAEFCPFPDKTFDFINASELIEHVDNPVKVLKEIKRMLAPDGVCYMSVPSRYSLKDPHYHWYFINWIPRQWADYLLDLTGKSKKGYGRQRLGEMHYFTYRQFRKLCKETGLKCEDSRPINLRFMRWILPTFHFFIMI